MALDLPRARVVLKPLSNNQNYHADLRASTIEVEPQQLVKPAVYPRLVQPLLSAQKELRLSFAFGTVSAVAQVSAPSSPVDRRYAVDFERTPFPVDSDLRREAQTVAKALGLGVFTADILISEAGEHYWVDVNPDGLHVAADDDSETLLLSLASALTM